MKNKHHIYLLVAFLTLQACKKSTTSESTVPPPKEKKRWLKEIVAERLPTPYFHFTYNDKGLATTISFASGFFDYALTYRNERLEKMVNIINNNELLYSYTNNKVSSIREIGLNGTTPRWHYQFVYNNKHRLKEVYWYRFPDTGGDSVLLRKVLLTYHPDANLASYEDYRNINGNDLTWIQTVAFSNYDKGINVDDFYLLKDFSDHLLYLPEVVLQYNNPAKSIITGTVNDYDINYTYQYTGNMPVSKVITMKQTRGQDAGRQSVFTTSYSYY